MAAAFSTTWGICTAATPSRSNDPDSTLTYRVQSIDVLSKEEVARNAEKIFAQTGAGRLVVITCDDWDGNAWRSNIVTIAAPV